MFRSFFVPVIFLVVALYTLSDYGINWDESKHLIRGQAYLHYILTGKHDFLDMPPYPALKGAPDSIDYNVSPPVRPAGEKTSQELGIRRSYFQSDFYTLDYYFTKQENVPLEAKHSHPEANGLLAAVSNYIFYQKLGVLQDIEAYHLFIVFVTFLLVLAVGLFTWKHFGVFASVVASSSLALYPLVFAESHFNVKDPVLMSFFGLALLTFWQGFKGKKVAYVILSAVFAGLALGTKFNTFFLPVILVPWALFVLVQRFKQEKLKRLDWLGLIGGTKMFVSLVSYPLIALVVLYALSPYLWLDPIKHFLEIVSYYQKVGRGTLEELSPYLMGGWNTYPLIWIFYTTPLPILFLSFLGLAYSLFLVLKRQSEVALLVLLWFAVPTVRYIWPGMNVFGGVRHIMEFIPAMALFVGMGAFFLIKCTQSISKRLSRLVIVVIIISFGFVVYEMASIHPNQNIYFNQLVGGLSGARERNIPSWGNTYGNVYLQGINWLNRNAETDARLALAVNYLSVIPRFKLRQDISVDNSYWSGVEHNGEYVMEMSHDWPLKNRYKYAYYETFLNPVYQVMVDGVPLLKIWKSDIEHTKAGYEKEIVIKPLSVVTEGQKLKIDFTGQVLLTRLIVKHSNNNCEEQGNDGFIAVSTDGQDYVREPGPLIDPESPYVTPEMDKDIFVYMFPARPARSIVFNSEKANSCILKDYKVTVWGLAK